MANEPTKGKFKIAIIGKPKTGTSKSTGKPYTIHEFQFEGDPNWYSTFWSDSAAPQVGQELEGTKSWDDSYGEGNWKFELERKGGNNGQFNPAGANATIYAAAANIVHNWLSVKPENYDKWLGAKPENADGFAYYIETIEKVAKVGKEAVTKMGAAPKAPESVESSTPPRAPAAEQPINSVSPLPEEDEVDLSAMG
jgi:hypothetical protein